MNLFVRDIDVFLWAFNLDTMYSCLPFYFYAVVCSFFIMRSICFCLSVISTRLGGILPLGQSLGELYPYKESHHLAIETFDSNVHPSRQDIIT